MAQRKIKQPSDNAFKGGALDRKYLGEIVDVINTPMEVKGGGKVVYSKEKIVIDLTEFSNGPQFYIIVNGELRIAKIPMKIIG